MKLKLAALLASTATNMIQVGQVASRVSVYEGCMMVGTRRGQGGRWSYEENICEGGSSQTRGDHRPI